MGGELTFDRRVKIEAVRRLLDSRESPDADRDFLERVRTSIFEDRVYTLTPKGEVIELPRMELSREPSPDRCPGQISWHYDRAEIIADGVVHAIGVCLGLLGARLRFHNAIWHGFVLVAASCHYSAVLACLPLA